MGGGAWRCNLLRRAGPFRCTTWIRRASAGVQANGWCASHRQCSTLSLWMQQRSIVVCGRCRPGRRCAVRRPTVRPRRCSAGAGGAAVPDHRAARCRAHAPRACCERGIAHHRRAHVGRPGAGARRQMSLMVACADAVFERQRALLDALSTQGVSHQRAAGRRRAHQAGQQPAGRHQPGRRGRGAGAGRTAGAGPGAHAGRDRAVSGQSWIGADRMRRAIAGDFAPRAHTTLLAKDTRLAVEAAGAAGFDRRSGGWRRTAFAARSMRGSAGRTTPVFSNCFGTNAEPWCGRAVVGGTAGGHRIARQQHPALNV